MTIRSGLDSRVVLVDLNDYCRPSADVPRLPHLNWEKEFYRYKLVFFYVNNTL